MPDAKGYSYNKYQDKPAQVLGNVFKGRSSEKHLDVPKTRMSSGSGKATMLTARQDKNRMRSPNRPAQQNRYSTVSGASLGKAPGWNTRGDNRKKALNRAYSMNQVSMARIMKGNVNANEGAYMKRGGDRQV